MTTVASHRRPHGHPRSTDALFSSLLGEKERRTPPRGCSRSGATLASVSIAGLELSGARHPEWGGQVCLPGTGHTEEDHVAGLSEEPARDQGSDLLANR